MKEKEKSYLFFENALVTWVLSEIETWKWRDFETLWTKFKFFHADCSFLLPCRVCAYDITQIFHGDFCSNLGARAMCWNYALISSGGLDKKKMWNLKGMKDIHWQVFSSNNSMRPFRMHGCLKIFTCMKFMCLCGWFFMIELN